MKATIRRAQEKDLAAVERIYDAIHTEKEAGRACTGWERKIYPTRRTAEDALVRDDLFVEEAEGRIVAQPLSIGCRWTCMRRSNGCIRHWMSR